MKRAYLFIIFLAAVFCQTAIAQEKEVPNDLESETEPVKKFEGMLAFGFALGIQGTSIPPVLNKVSIGARYRINNTWRLHAMPGLTFGFGETGLHLETGVSRKQVTLDYSINRLEGYGADDYQINHNVNLGYAFILNPNRKRDFLLWIKVGKSFHEVGYTEDDPPRMDGWNVEAKLWLPLSRIKSWPF